MDAEIVEDIGALPALKGAWAALADRARARPFQEPAWSTAWLATRGAADGYRPMVAVLRAGERLIGVLPLARRRYHGVRLLEWAGVGTLDYADALVDPSVGRPAALRAMWQAVRLRGGFDVVRLGQVRSDAACVDLIEELGARVEGDAPAFAVPVAWADGQAWLRSLPKRSRQAVTYGLRRLAGEGVAFRVGEAAGSRTELLDALLRQKLAWHEATGLEGLAIKPGGAEFVRTLAEAMAARGMLHLSALRSDEAVVACHLGFVRDGVLYYYLPTYDRAFAKHGPGHLLLSCLLMWCCDNGLRRLDLLVGPEPYKLRFHPTVETVRTFVLSGSALGRVAVTAHRAARMLATVRAPAGVAAGA
jgi:CelD/BcsL family acetyltransferase involved in cellulose biosynthesis